jgi:hypothetical protein
MSLEKTVNLDSVIQNRGLEEKLDTSVLTATDVDAQEQPDYQNNEEQFEQNENQEQYQEQGEEQGEQEYQQEEQQESDPYDDIPEYQAPEQDFEEQELNLDEVTISQDGVDVPVSSLINERNELYKRVQEIEKDDFLKGFIEFYKNGGDVTQYLEAKTDLTKIGDMDMLRRDFNKANSDLSPAAREKLFKRELERKYGFDPESVSEEDANSEDFKIAQELIKRDAFKLRESQKQEQQKFIIPKKEQVDPQVQRDAILKQITSQKEMKDFLENSLVRIDVPDEQGNYFAYKTPNPKEVTEMFADGNKFWNKLLTKDGKIDHNKANKVLSYAQDPVAFERELIKLGQRQGRREKILQDRNIDGRLNKDLEPSNTEKSEKENILEAFRLASKSKRK